MHEIGIIYDVINMEGSFIERSLMVFIYRGIIIMGLFTVGLLQRGHSWRGDLNEGLFPAFYIISVCFSQNFSQFEDFGLFYIGPVGWGCIIHWLQLCRGVRLSPNECPEFDA